MRNRILLADDNESVRRVIAALLENSGFTVCAEAVSGEDAVAKAVECKPDLIVIDLVMPSMNGLTASRKISEVLPGLPILLHTLHASSGLALEAQKHGISRVVPKSEGHSLVSQIRQLLGSDGSSLKPSFPSESENPRSAPLTAVNVEQKAETTESQPNSALRKAS